MEPLRKTILPLSKRVRTPVQGMRRVSASRTPASMSSRGNDYILSVRVMRVGRVACVWYLIMFSAVFRSTFALSSCTSMCLSVLLATVHSVSCRRSGLCCF